MQILLKSIQKQITDDQYKVIENEEFLKKFKKHNKVNVPALSRMLNDLQKLDYIDIKYKDENVFCLALTKKGRMQHLQKQTENKTITHIRKLFLLYTILFSILAGVLAFLGTWLANYLID